MKLPTLNCNMQQLIDSKSDVESSHFEAEPLPPTYHVENYGIYDILAYSTTVSHSTADHPHGHKPNRLLLPLLSSFAEALFTGFTVLSLVSDLLEPWREEVCLR